MGMKENMWICIFAKEIRCANPFFFFFVFSSAVQCNLSMYVVIYLRFFPVYFSLFSFSSVFQPLENENFELTRYCFSKSTNEWGTFSILSASGVCFIIAKILRYCRQHSAMGDDWGQTLSVPIFIKHHVPHVQLTNRISILCDIKDGGKKKKKRVKSSNKKKRIKLENCRVKNWFEL